MAAAEPHSIEQLRALLHSPEPRDNLKAMDAMVPLKGAAAPLVPDLLPFLTSEAYVPCTAREYEFSGHALLCEQSASLIEHIGAAPDTAALGKLLADPRVFLLPEASYDQGAYIGDYSGTTAAPAGLAARLVPLLREDAFALLPALAANARAEADEIAHPTHRALRRLATIASTASPASRAAFEVMIGGMAALPQAVEPRAHRGFDLRDLARDCRRILARG